MNRTFLGFAALAIVACGDTPAVEPEGGTTDGGIDAANPADSGPDAPHDSATTSDSGDASNGDPFVHASGTKLVLGGQAYRFTGFNRYNLAGGPQDSSCQLSGNATTYAQDVDATFSGITQLGGTVARFWAFQAEAGTSGADFTELDQVVAVAKKYNVRLVMTLENEWTACTQPASNKDATWYTTGYKSPYGTYKLSYVDYVTGIVKHFANEPQILMWQLMNEAESTDATALRNFAVAAATLIKSLDSHHLVSVGTLACGQNGVTGSNYQQLHADSHIDVLEAHDYGHETEAMSACITSDFAAANALNKPFFIGEAGISTTTFTQQQRATDMDAKIKAAASAPFAGWLMWSYGGPGNQYGVYAPADSDPLVPILQADFKLF